MMIILRGWIKIGDHGENMEKYKAIRLLMAEGEFRKALDHITRVLQKNPQDKEALKLENVCREMIHIQHACMEESEQKNEIPVTEYIAVHFRRLMKNLCHFCFLKMNLLPEKWQKILKIDRFRVWEEKFTPESDAGKDWLWELLFWDTKRRKNVFILLIIMLVLFTACFSFLVFVHSCRESDTTLLEDNFSAVQKAAYDGDAHAQFLIGENYYYGRTVKKDVQQARVWLIKASVAGHAQAAELLQKLMVELDYRTPDNEQLWKQDNKKGVGGHK